MQHDIGLPRSMQHDIGLPHSMQHDIGLLQSHSLFRVTVSLHYMDAEPRLFLWDVVFLLRRLTICLCAVVFKGNSYAQAVRIQCMLAGMAPPIHAHECHRVWDTPRVLRGPMIRLVCW